MSISEERCLALKESIRAYIKHLDQKLDESVPVEVQLSPEVYEQAQALLNVINCSVEGFAALCVLKTVRYLRDHQEYQDLPRDEIIGKVASEVIEELELAYTNRIPKGNEKVDE